MFEGYQVFKTEVAGRPFSIEVGKLGQLASGSVMARYGETAVFCAVTASAKPRDGIDFFPLSVDFEEKLYSVGRIPGSFMRREGRPTEKAILECKGPVYVRFGREPMPDFTSEDQDFEIGKAEDIQEVQCRI